MDNNTRYSIYSEAYNILQNQEYKYLPHEINDHFYCAKEILYEIENNIIYENNREFNFLTTLRNNIDTVSNLEMDLKIKNTYEQKLNLKINTWANDYSNILLDIDEEKKYIKTKDFQKKCLKELIKEITEIQNKSIDKILPSIKEFYSHSIESKNKVFLSYAYEDKGLSFALFLHFLTNKCFLFVDWMWNEKKDVCDELKSILLDEIQKCQQFLLLRTPNSDLEITGGSHQVRQWCSWECGIGYTLYKDEKFVVNFYDQKKPSNFFVQDFKRLSHIDSNSGKMIELK